MTAAIFGLAGVLVGGLLQLLAQQIATRRSRRTDEARRELLRALLTDERWTWRKLERCRRVIGADDETTKRLLIEIGARGSQNDDVNWGLVSRNPFEEYEEIKDGP
jgi:hypothetical protein